MRRPTTRTSERRLEADAVLGDEEVLRQIATTRPVQLNINGALHEILMNHHWNIEGEGMAAVLISYTGSKYKL